VGRAPTPVLPSSIGPHFMLIAGPECQDFSAAGYCEGLGGIHIHAQTFQAALRLSTDVQCSVLSLSLEHPDPCPYSGTSGCTVFAWGSATSTRLSTPSIHYTTPSMHHTTPSMHHTTPSMHHTTPSIHHTTPCCITLAFLTLPPACITLPAVCITLPPALIIENVAMLYLQMQSRT
jgi:hypothetical protein